MAMRAAKGTDQQEWDEGMQEQVIEVRAKALDDAIGKELGRMGSRQWEAVAPVLERRLSKQVCKICRTALNFSFKERQII